MQPFDPRLPRRRHGPKLIAGVLALTLASIAWQLTGEHPASANASTDSAAGIALQTAAFAQAEARPGLTAAQQVSIRVGPGETLEGAVRRTGIDPMEAATVVRALGGAMETVKIKAGLTFDAMIARQRDTRGSVRLVGLSMRTGPASTVTLSRTFDDALQVRKIDEKVTADTAVSCSEIEGGAYQTILAAGADVSLAATFTRELQHKVDFERDIHPGDRLCLIFDRQVSESGRTVEAGQLKYAELETKGTPIRFYAFDRGDGKALSFYDELGRSTRGLLLATPVSNARVTSRFGMRRHPVLGYTRAHQGVDFGAGTGTPILSAGDGKVVFVGRAGGYGNQIRVRHANGFETSYSHASRFASGMRVGTQVSQGQVIAYVGSTGMSTGPHLHYEIFQNGARRDPLGVKGQGGAPLSGADMQAFHAQREKLDGMLQVAVEKQEASQQLAMAATAGNIRLARN